MFDRIRLILPVLASEFGGFAHNPGNHERQQKNRSLTRVFLDGCHVHAYVLMTNHVHLLITQARLRGLSRMMQCLGRRYVKYINDVYRRTGTLWEGRYKASLVSCDAYLLACYRYIELNPVRTGMVEHPGAYRLQKIGL